MTACGDLWSRLPLAPGLLIHRHLGTRQRKARDGEEGGELAPVMLFKNSG